jgi:xyloglucan fucosyltransferase
MAYRTCIIENSSTNADYIVFDAVNGLGNRILGLIAVTTYALVTSRVLLINWQPGDNHQVYFEDLFLPLSSSDKIPFYYQYSLSRLINLIKNRWMNEIEWKTKTSRIPRDWAFYFDRYILCNNQIYNQSWFRQFGFYILNLIGDHIKWIRTDQYFVPLLTRNEKIRQPFITLFQNGQVFAELAKRFLHPVPKVNSIIEDFQTKYHLKNEIITIGVHMRSWSSSMTNHIEPFQKCIEHVIENVSR